MSGLRSVSPRLWLSLFICLSTVAPASALTWPPEDRWYQNPLGFDPLALHARNGFLLPLLVVTTGLLATSADSGVKRGPAYRLGAGLSQGYKYPETSMRLADAGVEWTPRRWMSVGVEAGIQWPEDDFNSTVGLAVRPYARFHPLYGERWRAYFECGGGLVRYLTEFPQPTDRDPRRGTLWNGTTRYGLGGEWRVQPSAWVYAGLLHVHASNGNTLGVERNPSHDSNGLFVGVAWRP